MGKKKGKGGGSAAPKEEPVDDDDDEEIDISDLAASLAAAQEEEEPPPAKEKAPPASTEGEDDAAPEPRVPAIKGQAETRYLPVIPYCEVTGLPFEMCEFSPLIAKCRTNFEQTYKTHFPDTPEDGLEALMAQLGMIGDVDAAAKKAQGGKKPAGADGGGGGGGGGGKKKEAPPAQIVVELNNRNKKKHITTVKGLEHFGVDAAAAAKLFGKRFACGSALKKGQNGQPDQIEIQGSCNLELPALMVDKLKVSLDDIYVVLDGKKVKACDAPTA